MKRHCYFVKKRSDTDVAHGIISSMQRVHKPILECSQGPIKRAKKETQWQFKSVVSVFLPLLDSSYVLEELYLRIPFDPPSIPSLTCIYFAYLRQATFWILITFTFTSKRFYYSTHCNTAQMVLMNSIYVVRT